MTGVGGWGSGVGAKNRSPASGETSALPEGRGGVTAARGFNAGAASAGIKEGPPRDDLAVVVADAPCVVHAVFTQCQVVAAPVVVSRERIRGGHAQGIVINSGNANACTGKQGLRDAREMAELAAAQTGIHSALMLVASTGLIGTPLPMDRIRGGIRQLRPTREGGPEAARAIMTTDLVPKEAVVDLELAGKTVTIGGMAKGAGMVHPHMATMLCVITTDAELDPRLARGALQTAADRSFNQISIDGDTSTNDTLALFASGAAGTGRITAGSADGARFAVALESLCVELARMVARDGEGATRLIEVRVEGARSDEQARRIAREVVRSNLVKAAIYGRDPNWGRIVAAVGNSGASMDPNAVDVFIGEQQVARGGAAALFDATAVSGAMGADEVVVRVVLDRGVGGGTAWGCDLTEGYVKINAEYST
jgi:glutamate N-acetyltransferase / amino-acid N-acetyltransferase